MILYLRGFDSHQPLSETKRRYLGICAFAFGHIKQPFQPYNPYQPLEPLIPLVINMLTRIYIIQYMPPCTCGLGLSYTNMQHHIPYPPVCTWQLLRGYSYRIHPCGHKHCCKQPFYTTLYTVDSYYTNGSNGSNGINGCND